MADEKLGTERAKRESLRVSQVLSSGSELEREVTVASVPGDLNIEWANETDPHPREPVGQYLLILAALSKELQNGFALTVGCITVVCLKGRAEPPTTYDPNISFFYTFSSQL